MESEVCAGPLERVRHHTKGSRGKVDKLMAVRLNATDWRASQGLQARETEFSSDFYPSPFPHTIHYPP